MVVTNLQIVVSVWCRSGPGQLMRLTHNAAMARP